MPDLTISDDAGPGALRVVFTSAPGGTPVLGARSPVAAADLLCSCGHVALPRAPDDSLPDHVCAGTMRASVQWWAVDEWGDPAPHQLAWPLAHKGRLSSSARSCRCTAPSPASRSRCGRHRRHEPGKPAWISSRSKIGGGHAVDVAVTLSI